MEVRRGVEDHVAFQHGISNETTAEALLRLFRVFLDEKHLMSTHREQALEILLAQEFKSMIPSKLPHDVRVAHKTGEISTHCHDAGIVFVPDRLPYVVAILTESAPANTKRQKAVGEIAAMVHRYLTSVPRDEHPERHDHSE
jgi:beta-lactamase class A